MKKYLPLSLALLFVVGINLYFRSFPIKFPQLKEQAQKMLEDGISQRSTQDVYQQFSQYDPLAKDRLIKERIADYKKYAANDIRRQQKEIYSKLKDAFQDESGQTYLMELDCWHWTRYVENVLDLGHPGDEVRNGRQYDTFMLSPQGDYLNWDDFLYYFTAWIYRIFSFFKKMTLLHFAFYLPLFFAALFSVVLFLFSFELGGYISGIVSCILVGLSANFIPRSCAGWFDKDILSIIWPIVVIWTYLQSYRDPITPKRRLLWILFASFWTGLFCSTWMNWWFIFVIVVLFEIIHLVFLSFLQWYYKKDYKGEIKQHFLSLIVFSSATLAWTIVFCGLQPLEFIYNQVRDAIFLSNPLEASIWPNVYSTVGELKKLSVQEIFDFQGGAVLFISSVLCLLFLLARYLFFSKRNNFKRASIVILTLWFFSMLYACMQGVRFVVFLAVPLGICVGWFLNECFEFVFLRAKTIFSKSAAVVFMIGLMALFCASTIDRANKVSKSIYPLMNDTWYKVLIAIRDTTPKDTIVNSWWDFGDWFKVVARRRVIFDGQSQNSPQAYWMAKAMLSWNEKESMGILRMLNNGGNKAYDIVNDYLKQPLQSVLLLESILALDSGKAKDVLLQFLPSSVADKVIMLVFEQPKSSACFVVDYSLTYKISAISYLGNWDFAKVYIAQNFNKQEKDKILDYLVKLGKNPQDMERLYQEAFLIAGKDVGSWISRPVSFYSGLVRGREKDGVVFFEDGFIYNMKEKTIYANNGQYPQSLFIQEPDRLTEARFNNANLPFSVLVFKDKTGYASVRLDRQLANSLFVRLYFQRGWGLQHFKLHVDAEDNNNFIGNYQIIW